MCIFMHTAPLYMHEKRKQIFICHALVAHEKRVHAWRDHNIDWTRPRTGTICSDSTRNDTGGSRHSSQLSILRRDDLMYRFLLKMWEFAYLLLVYVMRYCYLLIACKQRLTHLARFLLLLEYELLTTRSKQVPDIAQT